MAIRSALKVKPLASVELDSTTIPWAARPSLPSKQRHSVHASGDRLMDKAVSPLMQSNENVSMS